MLESGCKMELVAHRTEGRQQRAITINAVIASRLTEMTLLERKTPELPMELMFSKLEVACLHDFLTITTSYCTAHGFGRRDSDHG